MEVEISEDGFINALKSINGGSVVDELDRALIASVEGIFDNGGKADITLKFTVSRIANMESAVNIAHDVIVKLPKEDRPNKAMFITAGSGLADQHQKQEPLPLGPSTDGRRPSLVQVDKNTGEIKS